MVVGRRPSPVIRRARQWLKRGAAKNDAAHDALD
jgi:hypothetical protein